MISRIDHIAIAVRDYPAARSFFQTLLGAIPGATARDNAMKFTWEMSSLGDLSRLELLQPTEQGSFLDPFLSHRQGGVHHITMQTPDIDHVKAVLEKENIPYFGYNEYTDAYWKELFIHPRDAFGVLIQIAEFEADDWLSPSVRMAQGKAWELEKTETGCTLTLSHPGGGTVQKNLSREEIQHLINDLQAIIE